MNKPKFTYDDIVLIQKASGLPGRIGARAWVIAVFPERSSRPGSAFDRFPDGPIYTVEFEDGSSAEMHEDWLAREAGSGESLP